ncbi:MAG TPA: ABC transporter permease [Cellulomonas sp.]
MTTTLPATTAALPAVPARRGTRLIQPVYLRTELRRLLRNRRSVIIALVMPAAFFLLFGTATAYRTESAGHGNVTGYIMISMALYGTLLATTSGGASVSVERAQGWSRQLRLTSLRPAAYVVTKVVVAMVFGLASMAMTVLVGRAAGAQIDGPRLVACVAIAWVGSAVFAAFGLFMGYLLPAENVMQILGPVLAVLAFAGGLFTPLNGGVFATIARFMPTYGLAELTRAPLVGAAPSVWAYVNVIAWGALFASGAAWRFRRDTARV